MKRHSAERSRQGTRRSGNGVAQGAAPEAPGRSSWRSPSSQNPHDFQRTTPCLSCCSVCSMTPRCGATGSDSGASRIFDQNLGYQNSKCNFGIDSDAWRVHRADIFFTDGRQRRFRRRNTGVQLRSQRFAGKAVAGRTNALLQRQQAGFKSQAGCTLGPRSLPLSSAAAYASNHPTTPPMSPPSQPVAPASQTWTGFYIGAGAGAAHP